MSCLQTTGVGPAGSCVGLSGKAALTKTGLSFSQVNQWLTWLEQAESEDDDDDEEE